MTSKQSWRPLTRGNQTDLSMLLLVSCGGAGLSPFAPGTVGTIAAWALVAALPNVPQLAWLGIAAIAFVLGVRATDYVQEKTGVHDPGWVVIDEAAAYWLVYGCFGGGIVVQATMFFVFRVFDILKPPPARYLDRNWENGLGVMADDIAAGAWTIAAIWMLLPWIPQL